MTKEDLERMVKDQFLLEQAVIQWWLAAGETFPMPNTNKIIVFEYYLYLQILSGASSLVWD